MILGKSTAPASSLLVTMIMMVLLTGSCCLAYCPVVICPGFGTCSMDYDTDLSGTELWTATPMEIKSLKSVLVQRGFDPDTITTVPVERSDWIRVAGGLLDIEFYSNNSKPTGMAYGWYIDRLKQAVNDAYERSGGEKVILMAHSAGGWLARAAMADGTWCTNEEDGQVVKTNERVRCLVTLGSIHKVPEKEDTCVTRGCLKYTDSNFPGTFLKRQGVRYIAVGGAAVTGNKPEDGNHCPVTGKGLYVPLSSPEMAFMSYEKVSGKGNCIGDGIVPLEWTQLDGARNIKLDGVLHHLSDSWYGSERVIDRWLPAVLEEVDLVKKKYSKAHVGYSYRYGQIVNLRKVVMIHRLLLHKWNQQSRLNGKLGALEQVLIRVFHYLHRRIVQRGGIQ